jgi:allophanate hydrolase
MASTHITSLDLASLQAAYAAGTSAYAMLDLVEDRIDAASDTGIFISRPDRAHIEAQCAALPPFGKGTTPLWGVPFAVKDNIDVEGVATTAACPAFSYVAKADAHVVARLKAAGAIFIGKTNLDQFATGLVGVRSPYPRPRNSFDKTRVPGGSSSGSAVAVARGIATFALGTDTAGSGRVPAGLNNLVGLKPSLGLVSTAGVVPACRTLDCVSVFSTRIGDAEAAFKVMCGYDPADPYSRHATPSEPRTTKRLGIPRREDRLFFGDDVMARAFDAALAQLLPLASETVEIDMTGFFAVARLLYDGPWVAERHSVVRNLMLRDPVALLPVTRAIIGTADSFSATDAFEALYRLAALRRESETVWSSIDALVVPTAPIFPTLADLEADPIGPNSRLGTYTNFVNLLDLAALSVPGPFRADGLPAGITLIGPRESDLELARFGQRFEQLISGPLGALGLADLETT